MTAVTGRPTHATVPADIDACDIRFGLEPGKTYPILGWDYCGSGFTIRTGSHVIPCMPERCAFLDGRDWLLTTEPPAEEAAATIARLEREKAMLREAVKGLLKHAGRDPEADDETIAVYDAADAALAATEEPK